MLSCHKMPDTKTLLSAAASLAASAMVIRSIANDFIPREIQNYFFSSIHTLSHCFSSQLTIVIEEFKGLSMNQVFESANIYLGTITAPSIQRMKVSKAEKEDKLEVTMDTNEEIADDFDNIQVKWKFICTQVEPSAYRNVNMGDLNASLRSEVRCYELSFHKKHKDKVLNSYLPHVLERAKAIKEESNTVKLHTVSTYGGWDANEVTLKHPMTFKTLAIDSELSKTLIEDLDNFINGKEYYKRIGKAWKRGYLLYGPPGTGKSSLIAAIANHLKFDIYDLDLTDVQSNSDLRFLLLSMPSRSIVVIEDIDCSIKLQNRESENDEAQNLGENKVTLSGILNFMDGIWSCCGDQRIIIFTTNHKEQLDPALLRPGRMDMHICMSYCTTSVFKNLAFNYLGLSQHFLFEEIEEVIKEVEVTPAEVAGELMKSTNAEVSLQGLVKFLHEKKTGFNCQEYDTEIENTSNQTLTVMNKDVGRGGKRRRGRGRGRWRCV